MEHSAPEPYTEVREAVSMRYSLFVLTLLAHGVALAQEQPHYFTPIPGEGQNLRGSM